MSISFACVLSQIDEIAVRCAELVPDPGFAEYYDAVAPA